MKVLAYEQGSQHPKVFHADDVVFKVENGQAIVLLGDSKDGSSNRLLIDGVKVSQVAVTD